MNQSINSNSGNEEIQWNVVMTAHQKVRDKYANKVRERVILR